MIGTHVIFSDDWHTCDISVVWHTCDISDDRYTCDISDDRHTCDISIHGLGLPELSTVHLSGIYLTGSCSYKGHSLALTVKQLNTAHTRSYTKEHSTHHAHKSNMTRAHTHTHTLTHTHTHTHMHTHAHLCCSSMKMHARGSHTRPSSCSSYSSTCSSASNKCSSSNSSNQPHIYRWSEFNSTGAKSVFGHRRNFAVYGIRCNCLKSS